MDKLAMLSIRILGSADILKILQQILFNNTLIFINAEHSCFKLVSTRWMVFITDAKYYEAQIV